MIQLVQSHNLLLKILFKNNNTNVLALVIFYQTKHTNAMKDFVALICFFNTIIDIYAYTDYLACQPKKLSFIFMDRKIG